MSFKARLFIPFVLFVLLALFLWKGLDRNPHAVPSPFINRSLPDFRMASLSDPNEFVNNKVFKGHVSLLNVFASWCSTCRAEHPMMMDIARSHLVMLYGLNYKDKRETAKKFIDKYGDPYVSIIYDPRGLLGVDLGVYGTPEVFVIDRQGVIRYKYVGAITPEVWRNTLRPEILLLKKQKVQT